MTTSIFRSRTVTVPAQTPVVTELDDGVYGDAKMRIEWMTRDGAGCYRMPEHGDTDLLKVVVIE